MDLPLQQMRGIGDDAARPLREHAAAPPAWKTVETSGAGFAGVLGATAAAVEQPEECGASHCVLQLGSRVQRNIALAVTISSAPDASAAIRISHAPTAEGPFRQLQPDEPVCVADAASTQHIINLGAGGYVQRYLRLDLLQGGAKNSGGGSWAVESLSIMHTGGRGTNGRGAGTGGSGSSSDDSGNEARTAVNRVPSGPQLPALLVAVPSALSDGLGTNANETDGGDSEAASPKAEASADDADAGGRGARALPDAGGAHAAAAWASPSPAKRGAGAAAAAAPWRSMPPEGTDAGGRAEVDHDDAGDSRHPDQSSGRRGGTPRRAARRGSNATQQQAPSPLQAPLEQQQEGEQQVAPDRSAAPTPVTVPPLGQWGGATGSAGFPRYDGTPSPQSTLLDSAAEGATTTPASAAAPQPSATEEESASGGVGDAAGTPDDAQSRLAPVRTAAAAAAVEEGAQSDVAEAQGLAAGTAQSDEGSAALIPTAPTEAQPSTPPSGGGLSSWLRPSSWLQAAAAVAAAGARRVPALMTSPSKGAAGDDSEELDLSAVDEPSPASEPSAGAVAEPMLAAAAAAEEEAAAAGTAAQEEEGAAGQEADSSSCSEADVAFEPADVVTAAAPFESAAAAAEEATPRAEAEAAPAAADITADLLPFGAGFTASDLMPLDEDGSEDGGLDLLSPMRPVPSRPAAVSAKEAKTAGPGVVDGTHRRRSAEVAVTTSPPAAPAGPVMPEPPRQLTPRSATRRPAPPPRAPSPAVAALTPTKATCMGVRLTRAQLLQQEQRRAAAAGRAGAGGDSSPGVGADCGASGRTPPPRGKPPRRLTLPGATGPDERRRAPPLRPPATQTRPNATPPPTRPQSVTRPRSEAPSPAPEAQPPAADGFPPLLATVGGSGDFTTATAARTAAQGTAEGCADAQHGTADTARPPRRAYASEPNHPLRYSAKWGGHGAVTSTAAAAADDQVSGGAASAAMPLRRFAYGGGSSSTAAEAARGFDEQLRGMGPPGGIYVRAASPLSPTAGSSPFARSRRHPYARSCPETPPSLSILSPQAAAAAAEASPEALSGQGGTAAGHYMSPGGVSDLTLPSPPDCGAELAGPTSRAPWVHESVVPAGDAAAADASPCGRRRGEEERGGGRGLRVVAESTAAVAATWALAATLDLEADPIGGAALEGALTPARALDPRRAAPAAAASRPASRAAAAAVAATAAGAAEVGESAGEEVEVPGDGQAQVPVVVVVERHRGGGADGRLHTQVYRVAATRVSEDRQQLSPASASFTGPAASDDCVTGGATADSSALHGTAWRGGAGAGGHGAVLAQLFSDTSQPSGDAGGAACCSPPQQQGADTARGWGGGGTPGWDETDPFGAVIATPPDGRSTARGGAASGPLRRGAWAQRHGASPAGSGWGASAAGSAGPSPGGGNGPLMSSARQQQQLEAFSPLRAMRSGGGAGANGSPAAATAAGYSTGRGPLSARLPSRERVPDAADCSHSQASCGSSAARAAGGRRYSRTAPRTAHGPMVPGLGVDGDCEDEAEGIRSVRKNLIRDISEAGADHEYGFNAAAAAAGAARSPFGAARAPPPPAAATGHGPLHAGAPAAAGPLSRGAAARHHKPGASPGGAAGEERLASPYHLSPSGIDGGRVTPPPPTSGLLSGRSGPLSGMRTAPATPPSAGAPASPLLSPAAARPVLQLPGQQQQQPAAGGSQHQQHQPARHRRTRSDLPPHYPLSPLESPLHSMAPWEADAADGDTATDAWATGVAAPSRAGDCGGGAAAAACGGGPPVSPGGATPLHRGLRSAAAQYRLTRARSPQPCGGGGGLAALTASPSAPVVGGERSGWGVAVGAADGLDGREDVGESSDVINQYAGSISPRRVQRLREFARAAVAATHPHLDPTAAAAAFAPTAPIALGEATFGWQLPTGPGIADESNGPAAAGAEDPSAALRSSLQAIVSSRAGSRTGSQASLHPQGSSGSCAAAVAQLLAGGVGGVAALEPEHSGASCGSAAASVASAAAAAAAAAPAIAALADAINAAAAAAGSTPACLRITLDPSGLASAAAAAAAAATRQESSTGGGGSTSADLGAALAQLLTKCGSGAGIVPGEVCDASGGRAGSGGGGEGSGRGVDVGGHSCASSLSASVDQVVGAVEAELAPQALSGSQDVFVSHTAAGPRCGGNRPPPPGALAQGLTLAPPLRRGAPAAAAGRGAAMPPPQRPRGTPPPAGLGAGSPLPAGRDGATYSPLQQGLLGHHHHLHYAAQHAQHGAAAKEPTAATGATAAVWRRSSVGESPDVADAARALAAEAETYQRVKPPTAAAVTAAAATAPAAAVRMGLGRREERARTSDGDVSSQAVATAGQSGAVTPRVPLLRVQKRREAATAPAAVGQQRDEPARGSADSGGSGSSVGEDGSERGTKAPAAAAAAAAVAGAGRQLRGLWRKLVSTPQAQRARSRRGGRGDASATVSAGSTEVAPGDDRCPAGDDQSAA